MKKVKVKSDLKFSEFIFKSEDKPLKVARLYNFIVAESAVSPNTYQVDFENGDGQWFSHSNQTPEQVEHLMNH